MSLKHLQMIRNVINEFEPKQKVLPYLELDSMMLAQVIEVAKQVSQNDINPTHVQNWVRRKYLPHPQKKKYSHEQVANILLINDLRDILSLEEVSHLLGYVNESFLDTSDDRIDPAKLYRYYSQIFDESQMNWEKSLQELEKEIEETLIDDEMVEEDREKVASTLVILNLLAKANLYKQVAKRFLNRLET
ncbi:DUF1836 domain-containing protein [Desulfosporosinus sp.]|uniref:DUF1836 domain-containing protein n=1 Tax=Desulfosporosinus sp. TaxID=157907 RepID=UPI000E972FB2|nr:DUF1836 domain-containing protein [Desulfosporosinus sp.]MBC2722621.1 DUF1836 domain-containing protein [Desulfosporosinus sp.]MBC2727941.1 DUF1836 domain-containing protein [Desulfosporosinus sp.]HBV86688.1 hypothetical protein [Desulfosporosinus sp.]